MDLSERLSCELISQGASIVEKIYPAPSMEYYNEYHRIKDVLNKRDECGANILKKDMRLKAWKTIGESKCAD